jgi:hypothetical protein
MALISIPSNGMSVLRGPNLAPLRTSFVPFDASLQSPDPVVVQFSIAAPSGKRVVLASNVNSYAIFRNFALVPYCALDRHGQGGAVAILSGRSPPPA